MDWRKIVAEKRAIRDRALQPYLANDLHLRPETVDKVSDRSRIEPQVFQAITEISNIEELHCRLRRGDFSAEDVTSAYIKRLWALNIKQPLFPSHVAAKKVDLIMLKYVGRLWHIKWWTNAITEVLFEDALKQAKGLDSLFKTTGKLQGPLHGIPITVKDQFNVQNVDTTLGYVGRSFAPAVEDAVLVQILKGLGAVIIAKTNLPQSIMWCETENPLFGLTVNPRNANLTPGGSSGGESALLALHASILGFGTDLGGSIRMPQHMVGLYGFKPSSARLPYQNVPVSTEGQEHVPSSVGPMTRDLSSLIYIMRVITDREPWKLDPRCVPLPWREKMFTEIQSRPLVIGLIMDDGVVKVHPPIQRALEELSQLLKDAGHEIVQWDTNGHEECIEIMDQYYTVDGGEDIRRDVEVAGEPFLPHIEALMNRGKPISVYQYWQLNKRKMKEQKRYLDKWNAAKSPSGHPVDILLTPTMPHTSVPHRTCRWVGYTKIWNVLDYPALTFPVGHVCKEKDKLPQPPYEPRNTFDEWNWSLYDLDVMAGHPVNLQIVSKKLEEEKLLGAAVVIENLLRGRN